MIKVKKFPYFLLILLSILALFSFRSHAAVLSGTKETEVEKTTELVGFIPPEYKYYICEKWDYEGTYVIGFFKEKPVFDTSLHEEDNSGQYFYHVKAEDGSKITFYDFFSEEDMFNWIYTNDYTVTPENCRVRIDYLNYMRLVPDQTVYYTNLDLIPTDTGELYVSSNPYTQTVIETVLEDKTYLVDTFDSGYLINGILSEVISMLPILLSVLIGFVCLRKGISFITDLIRGA